MGKKALKLFHRAENLHIRDCASIAVDGGIEWNRSITPFNSNYITAIFFNSSSRIETLNFNSSPIPTGIDCRSAKKCEC